MFPTAAVWLRSSLIVGVSGLMLGGLAAADPAALDDAAERYRPALVEDIGQAAEGVRALRRRVVANDLNGAKAAWIAARAGWERSEVFTNGFVPDLDREIDAWPDARKGFHAIEAKLFGAHATDVLAETDALLGALTDVGEQLRTIRLTPQRLLNGIARLAYELGDSKVDGGELRLSGTSVDDMRNNIDGIEIAYRAIFAAEFEAADTNLAKAVDEQIARLKSFVKVRDLKRIDMEGLRAASEALVVTVQNAAPRIGLKKPALEETAP